MTDDWKKGDNAQCLKTIGNGVGRLDGTCYIESSATPRPRIDGVYTVVKVRRLLDRDWLSFAEFPVKRSYDARFFRKIDPVKIDIFNKETEDA